MNYFYILRHISYWSVLCDILIEAGLVEKVNKATKTVFLKDNKGVIRFISPINEDDAYNKTRGYGRNFKIIYNLEDIINQENQTNEKAN